MQLSPGYKQTDVGVIPEDWNVKTIDEVAFVTSGKRLPLGSSLVDLPTPHPYIRVTDMRPGTVDLADIKYVPESVFPAIRRYRIYQADIFVSVAGSLGIAGKVPPEIDGANLTENADRITNIICSQDYLLYVLLSPLIQNTIDSIRTVGAQPKLALTRLRKFAIPLPATEGEQRAIAAALSDVDALLSGLDRLIAKKRDIKQAVMQQVLAGETRLPGFSGEWEVKQLRELGEISGAGVDKKIRENEVSVRLLNYMDVYKRDFLKSSDFSHETTARPDQARRCSVQRGDVFFTPTSEVRDDIGHSAVAIEDIPDVVYSYHVVRLRLLENWDVRFRAYAFKVNRFMDQARTQCEGSGTRYVITLPKFRALEVKFPSDVDEQAAIATVLADMDAEIEALEARRAKTRNLKQAMMQELLTGKTRLRNVEDGMA
jgi:type I restriction enzyme S subunit